MSTASTTSQTTDTLVERFGLKALVESCLVLEEGIAGIKDIDIGMMAGAGIMPGPFARADEQGLDEVLAALERAQSQWGDNFAPPLILRRLVNQGRLGQKSGQGFFPYPRPDGDSSYETIALETRGDIGILWLNRPPANPLSPAVVRELADAWHNRIDGKLRAVVVASSNPFTFAAGDDIKEFTKMKPDAEGADLLESAHGFMTSMEKSRTVTIASVNSLAFGGGCELAMACDFRIAAESATFGQPEINLGIIPGFGGTQRLPRLVADGEAARLAELIRASSRAVVLTGAGISVPSGIPDFRTPGKGLWEKVNPMEVAHIDVFRREPDRFWHFYGQRFSSLKDVQPNDAHRAVAELERRGLVRGVVT